MKFTVHVVIKNEDRWIWFALQSILPFAEKVLIFDTGSTDRTVEVVKFLQSSKITFEGKGPVDRKGLVRLRQEQIDRTGTEWFLILDGDEIWPERELKKLLKAAETSEKHIAALVNRNRNCVGDVYHYLPETSGKYSLGGKVGSLTIRMLRKTPGLKISGEYPLESYADKNGPVEKQDNNLQFVDCWYLHASFLQRSSMDQSKLSGSFGRKKIWERGLKMKEAELPEVLFENGPSQSGNPLAKRGIWYELLAYLFTPFISLKRMLR